MAGKALYRLRPQTTSVLQRLFSFFVNNKINTKVNFSLSDDDDDDDDDDVKKLAKNGENTTKLPPPYNPFNKKPAIEEPDDPNNLQEIFHKLRTEGLTNSAIKMFDALSKDGLTHEALQLFSQIKDKSQMPDVIAHTAVIEAYANASQPKQALNVFLRMLASGVVPNAYTYSVIIRGLAAHSKTVPEARKYLLEMMAKGMRPNAPTYPAVFEAFLREDKMDKARQLLQQMKAKGFLPDEKAVKQALNSTRGHVYRGLISLLFEK